MTKSTKLLCTMAMIAGFAMPALAQDRNTVVANVNGTEITLGHMLMVRASLPEQYQTIPDEQLWEGILSQLVQQELLAQDDLANESDRVRIALENERRQLLAAETVTAIADDAASEEAVLAAYQAQFVEAEQAPEYNASHILVESEDEAKELVTALEGGADFAELAAEKSTGPSGPNGGSLGWFGAGAMVPEFQTAVETMEVGSVSAPVQTQFGWHVIKLNEKRAQEAPNLEAVRQQLSDELQRKAVADHITSLEEGADITRTGVEEVDASVLSNLDLLEE